MPAKHHHVQVQLPGCPDRCLAMMLRCELSPAVPCDSSLISACERGGRLDRALEWFDRMKDAGVAADGITYRCADHMQALQEHVFGLTPRLLLARLTIAGCLSSLPPRGTAETDPRCTAQRAAERVRACGRFGRGAAAARGDAHGGPAGNAGCVRAPD